MYLPRAGLAICAVAVAGLVAAPSGTAAAPGGEAGSVRLPEPRRDGEVSVEEALARRRSCRRFSGQPLELSQLSQLLWAAQGLADGATRRTAPSAGGLYPLEVLVVAGEVAGLEPGVYRYRPAEHGLASISAGDRRAALAQAALGQAWVREGAAVLVLAGQYGRTTGKYGERGRRYVHIEVGHAAQNVYLQATGLGLGAVIVGAFDDEEVRAVLGLGEGTDPLAILPVGHPARGETR